MTKRKTNTPATKEAIDLLIIATQDGTNIEDFAFAWRDGKLLCEEYNKEGEVIAQKRIIISEEEWVA